MLNFNADDVASNYILGKTGEHNATQLVITPPSELSEDIRTDHYRIAFFSAGKTVLSENITGEELSVALSSSITKNPRLSLQLIAYDDEGEFIGKSKKIDGFLFEPSISSTAIEIGGENNDIASEIVNICEAVEAVKSSVSAEIERAKAKENELFSGKVDKVEGKGLSTNDFTDAEKQRLSTFESYDDANVLERLSYAEEDITNLDLCKVDKLDGKELSSNDFSDTEKQKLASLNGRIFYGTCTTSASTATKIVSTDADFSLIDGTVLIVSFSKASGGSDYSPRYLNVNSSGSKKIANTNSSTLSTWQTFGDNSVVTFVYSGNKWIQMDCHYATSNMFGRVKLTDSLYELKDAASHIAASAKAVCLVNEKAEGSIDDIEALEKRTDMNEKKLEYLKKLTRGQAWDTEIDNTVANSKPVPQGAKAVAINKLGGRTDETLSTSYCSSIISRDSLGNTIASFFVPSSLASALSNEGYGQSNGTVYNYIDFTNMKYYKFGSYINGVWTENVKIIDVSQYLSQEALLTVASGGSVAFISNNNADIYSEIEFAINLSEATE